MVVKSTLQASKTTQHSTTKVDFDSRTDRPGYWQPLDSVGQKIQAVLMANSADATDYH